MKRVKNPYGSSDNMSQSLSTSMQKSKRRIEIEKLSDNDEPYEDSYKDDEFEDTVVSKSNEKNRSFKEQYITPTQQPRKVNINNSGRKMRPNPKTKDATPIKEEDVEEEYSDQNEDDRFKEQQSSNQKPV